MHADGEVVHDPQRHPRRNRLRLRGGELLVELPLQPTVEIHGLRVVGDELGDTVGAGMPHAIRATDASHRRTSRPAHTRWRNRRAQHPSRAQKAAYASSRPAVRGTEIDQLQGRPLGCPCGVTVDGVQRGCVSLHAVAQPPHPATLAQISEFRDGFDPEIQRVDEAPRCRQIRRRLHRCGRRGCVQRIDQDITGAVRRGRPDRKVSEIGEVADTPGLSGPDTI